MCIIQYCTVKPATIILGEWPEYGGAHFEKLKVNGVELIGTWASSIEFVALKLITARFDLTTYIS